STRRWRWRSSSPEFSSPSRRRRSPVSPKRCNDRKERKRMTKHRTGTREEWLAARLEFLEAGKELTPRGDKLAPPPPGLGRGAQGAGAGLGADGEGVRLRDRRGERRAGGSLRRAFPAPRLPLHVRARLRGGVSVVFVDRGRLRRLRRPPRQPRRHPLRRLSGA